jgi:hypothetical protein
LRPSSRRALVALALLSVVVARFVPYGPLVFYPFTLLGAWAHEMGHGLTAPVVRGRFDALDVFADGTAFARTTVLEPELDGAVALGGLLAPAAVGALLLAASRGPRAARLLLGALASALVFSLGVWVRTFAGWVALPTLAAVATLVARYGRGSEQVGLAQLLGLRVALEVFVRRDYLVALRLLVDEKERSSDLLRLAQAWPAPGRPWGALVVAVSLGLVLAGMAVAWGPWGSRRLSATLASPHST